ncbi:MAG TPA: DUF3048 domain-containing protein [Jiangellales bacterium]|nr:DUF3048 domain-containing protein [Jiangellales bacterium]
MRRLPVLLAALITLTGGCSPEPDARPTPGPTPTTAEPIWPLTGLPASADAAVRPVLVVKVDNTASARPQVGLSAADIVVEELVEGGLTRLAVMYHSTLPNAVTPVRSVRTSDIGIVLPTGGALVASGGARRVLQEIEEAGVTVLTEGTAGFSRASGRPSLYSVTVDPEEVLTAVGDLAPPDVPYLPWAGPDDEAGTGEPATTVTARFSGGRTSVWDWADGAWHRRDDLAADGDEFVADTLLVLRVAIRDAGYTDPAGNFVPESVLEGVGDAVLFAGGAAVEGTWTKLRAEEPFALSGPNGEPLSVPVGRTWIGLVPEEDGDVSWTTD